MFLSDVSVKRPVLATVLSLLLIVFGIVSFQKLPLREYPNIDAPVVSIDTRYRGASSNVVETRITEVIEESIAGIEGIKSINSTSSDGRSRITVEFTIERNIEDAANDIRDRVSTVANKLPEESDPPQVQKSNSDDDVILWMSLSKDSMSVMELTDYARRYIVDRFSALDGVAQVRIGGAKDKVMRIWLDRSEMAARNLTATDIENVLRAENLELPAGSIKSINRDFTVRISRNYLSPQDFGNLVLSKGDNGYLVRLSDVARVEIAPEEERGTYRGNGVTMIGVGIIKQSTANALEVSKLVGKEMAKVKETLPEGMIMDKSYDTSVFIDSAVHEVYKTLVVAIILVILVIYAFLGNLRATLIPAVTVPVSLIATFIVLYFLGYTINLLTLLALVLAIGLVVDDAIVVLENIYRRIEMGEPKLVAAYRGSRQVGFAVIVTTLVLVVVFIPIGFLEGDLGRLFSEFAVAMAAGVAFSGFVALSLSPMMASKILDEKNQHNKFTIRIDNFFKRLREKYRRSLTKVLNHPKIAIWIVLFCIPLIWFLVIKVPGEFAPKEDRGMISLNVTAPEGSSDQYTLEHMKEVEKRLMPFVKSGEFHRLIIRTPRSLGGASSYNSGIVVIVLNDWGKRKPIWYYVDQIKKLTSDLVGVKIAPVVRQAFSGGSKPIQFVISGPDYMTLAKWRDIVINEARNNDNIVGLDYDYKETKPQIAIIVKKDRAGELGVSVDSINKTLETMLGSRRVTTFIEEGEEYDVLLEGERNQQMSPNDISNIYVRSERSGSLIPLSNLIELNEFADADGLNRYNRLRSITLDGSLEKGYSLGQALDYLENIVRTKLPDEAVIDYKGESQDYKEAGYSVYFTFIMALIIVFLVMAAQFESFIHPLVIMFTVPFAIIGGLLGLYLTGQTLNIYSEIGLVMLVGLSTKNGILIVEFANQLRDEGLAFKEALIDAALKRLRPIIMTSVTAIMGSVPLVLSFGAGAESRYVIGIVIVAGVFVTTIFTIYVIPVMYLLLAKNTSSPHLLGNKLEQELLKYTNQK